MSTKVMVTPMTSRRSVLAGRATGLLVTGALMVATISGCGGPADVPASEIGTVTYSWGIAAQGALGTGSTAASAFPQVGVLAAGTSAVAAGRQGLLVLANSRVLTSETTLPGSQADPAINDSPSPQLAQVTFPANVQISAIAAGSSFSLAVAKDGAVYSWGANDLGQLGDGSTTATQSVRHVNLPSGVQIDAVAAGNRYALALSSKGQVYAWGRGSSGQLGNGSTKSESTPVAVTLPAAVRGKVTAISAGGDHAMALAGGEVLAWGSIGNGQSGNGGTATFPQRVSLASDAVSIAAGSLFDVAVLSDGSAWSWGSNSVGQLGIGSNAASAAPVRVALGEVKLRSVSASTGFAVGLREDGQVMAWGLNSSGQLGDGTTTNRSSPVLVATPKSAKMAGVTAGPTGVIALASPSSVKSLHLTVGPAHASRSQSVALTVVAFDSLKRSLGAIEPAVLQFRMAGGACTQNMCASAEPGRHEVRATFHGVTASGYVDVAVTNAKPQVFRLPSNGGSHWLRWTLIGVGVLIIALGTAVAVWLYRRRAGQDQAPLGGHEGSDHPEALAGPDGHLTTHAPVESGATKGTDS